MEQLKAPVRKFMQKDIEVIGADASISEAAKKMFEKNIGSLIVEEQGELKGLITERDIARSIFIYNAAADAKIKEIRITPLVSVDPDDPITEVAEKISKTQILRIPVIRDGEVMGIMSSSDLAVLFTMFEKEEIERKFGPLVGNIS